MTSLFHTQHHWTQARALAFLCCGTTQKADRDVITDWMVDTSTAMPAGYAKYLPSLVETLKVLNQTWPDMPRAQRLHPVIWLWFGLDKARAQVHTDCLSQFVAYIEDNINNGYRPIIRRHIGSVASTYPGCLLTPDGEIVRSLLVATLPYRPFDKQVAAQQWRSEKQRNDLPRPQKKGQPLNTEKRSADSPNCLEALSKLLGELALLGQEVEHLPKPNGSLQFRSLGLKRQQLIARLMARRGGSSIKGFAPSTLMRAMSAVVECKPGPVESRTLRNASNRLPR